MKDTWASEIHRRKAIIALGGGVAAAAFVGRPVQAATTACMATLRMVGQTLYIYASENKGSLCYGFYRPDAVVSPNPNQVDEIDPNTRRPARADHNPLALANRPGQLGCESRPVSVDRASRSRADS